MMGYQSEIISFIRFAAENPETSASLLINENGIAENELSDSEHHFIILIKPELLESSCNIEIKSVLNLVFEHLNNYNTRIGRVGMFSAKYVEHNQLLEKNYHLLNQISHFGMAACSTAIQSKILEAYPYFSADQKRSNILGGYQFLKQFLNFTASSLSELSDSLGTKKLASGVYALSLEMEDEIYLILNPFHPYQIEMLTKKGSSLIALECFSNKNWSCLREEMIGYINPELADVKSLRRKLFSQKDKLNLPKINIAYNGVHISPGPLEAVFQLNIFFDKEHCMISQSNFTNNHFGKLLASWNVSFDFVKSLINNPAFKINDEYFPALDFTENLNNSDALNFIKKIFNLAIERRDS